MSDSNFSKLCEWKKVHEVVDEAWAEDCLSDDEVELPAGETFGDEGAYPQRRIIKKQGPLTNTTYLLLSSVAMTTFFNHQDRRGPTSHRTHSYPSILLLQQ